MTPLAGLIAVLVFVLVVPALVGLFDVARCDGGVREWWLS